MPSIKYVVKNKKTEKYLRKHGGRFLWPSGLFATEFDTKEEAMAWLWNVVMFEGRMTDNPDGVDVDVGEKAASDIVIMRRVKK